MKYLDSKDISYSEFLEKIKSIIEDKAIYKKKNQLDYLVFFITELEDKNKQELFINCFYELDKGFYKGRKNGTLEEDFMMFHSICVLSSLIDKNYNEIKSLGPFEISSITTYCGSIDLVNKNGFTEILFDKDIHNFFKKKFSNDFLSHSYAYSFLDYEYKNSSKSKEEFINDEIFKIGSMTKEELFKHDEKLVEKDMKNIYIY